jgi:hypothetical protein
MPPAGLTGDRLVGDRVAEAVDLRRARGDRLRPGLQRGPLEPVHVADLDHGRAGARPGRGGGERVGVREQRGLRRVHRVDDLGCRLVDRLVAGQEFDDLIVARRIK